MWAKIFFKYIYMAFDFAFIKDCQNKVAAKIIEFWNLSIWIYKVVYDWENCTVLHAWSLNENSSAPEGQ